VNLLTLAFFGLLGLGGVLTIAVAYHIARRPRWPWWVKSFVIPVALVAGALCTFVVAASFVWMNIRWGE
jgi:hypothetical protein